MSKKYQLNLTEVINLFQGDSLEVLKQFPDNFLDTCISDPPYGISFMQNKAPSKDTNNIKNNKKTIKEKSTKETWDQSLPPKEIWEEVYRILKPNGVLVAMSATRTYHRLAVQLEEIGFHTEQSNNFVFGSGFPKASNLSKAFDREAGVEGEVIGTNPNHRNSDALLELGFQGGKSDGAIKAPSSDLAKQWKGFVYGTQSLKPALEPCYVGRKEPKGEMEYTSPIIYQAKPSKKERNIGFDSDGNEKNNHPTVKPIALMKRLIEKYCPKDKLVLDPFLGSGTTLIACIEAGRKGIGIEREKDFFKIAKTRITHTQKQKGKVAKKGNDKKQGLIKREK